MNSCWSKSPQYSAQNHVQNRDFSENPRCGPYKNHENAPKNMLHWGNWRKSSFFSFRTLWITVLRQFATDVEKWWFRSRKSSELVEITKNEQLLKQITSIQCSKPCSKSWFFGKSSMRTLQKSRKCVEKYSVSRQLTKIVRTDQQSRKMEFNCFQVLICRDRP